jgi:type IV pilus assembly protein PilV
MRRSENGFSLVEILVSAFVLAFGVIGAIGMQLTALRTTQQSSLHTNALHLAADMADRMRANLARMREADADNPYLQVDFQSGGAIAHTGFDCYADDVDCDPVQLAQFDIAEWLTQLDRSLPNVRVRICRDAHGGTEKRFDWSCEAAEASAPAVIKIGWRNKDEVPTEYDSAPRLDLLVASFPA